MWVLGMVKPCLYSSIQVGNGQSEYGFYNPNSWLIPKSCRNHMKISAMLLSLFNSNISSSERKSLDVTFFD